MPSVLQVDAFAAAVGGRRFCLPHLRLEAGACAALFAPSGAGKSTVLRGLFRPSGPIEGTVRLGGEDFGALAPPLRRQCLRTHVAAIAQDAMAALDPFRSLSNQVGAATGAGPDACEAAFAGLGFARDLRLGARYPAEVSGGQAQRALFAVAALRRPLLVVADEPTANLDDENASRVGAALQRLRGEGAAVLLATHDPRLVAALSPEVLVPTADGFRPGAPPRPAWPPRGPVPEGSAATRLSIRGLCVAHGDRAVLRGVDLDVRDGELVAVLGSSGAGKTTLLRAAAGRLAANAGAIERPSRRAAVQLVSQDAGGSLTPGRTLRSLVAEVAHAGFDVDATARALGLADSVLSRTAASASGGERRRAALLRALAVDPEVLLLDEPTASLDRAAASALVATVLAHQQRSGCAVVLATHDEELAAAIAHRVLRLVEGQWESV